MPLCPKCAQFMEDVGQLCPRCGQAYSIRKQSIPYLQKRKDKMLGRLLGRHFAVVHLLGNGMMGTVYEGIHIQLRRPCAIKIVKPELVSQATTQERFKREVRAIALLNHPNIVTVYDYDVEEDGTSYLAMEYLNAKMLSDYAPYGPEMTLGMTIHLLLQLLYALWEAHRNGVVHRDLKPENLAICHYPGYPFFLKVLDFGLAKLVEGKQITVAGEILGTPLYMSPEQAMASGPVTHAADIYAVGAMAFELLTGHPPYDHENPMVIMMNHVNKPIPELQPRDGFQISTELKEVIYKCLAKKPEDRYASIEALIKALESTPEAKQLHLSSQGPSLQREGVLGKMSGWFKR